MKKYSRVIKGTIKVLVVAFMILIILNGILNRFDGAYNTIGYRTYTILTGSMEPKIKPGDIVLVKKVAEDELKEGDIITFKEDNRIVTHRIVEKNNNGFITKGDNNNVKDSEIVKENNIIGQVKLVIPKLGYVLVFLSKPIVISAILIIIALIIIWDVFKN
ncbi:signal peptidase I [Clostridium fallax]|uniref:Signal peptidase I n=1 Tax=Clostridium fallax TaxID=1533 RepID=A0A1M4SG19_9CLOT|nr:signal peptidase I [Clostridium fallax]SHE31204.1 Signal peptidase I Serine peptidase. MEROPS family S26B [Clostridium fallax]SQB07816.1 signal peptidase type I [Clostridium fallax]